MAGIGINTSFRFWTEDFRHSIMYFFSPQELFIGDSAAPWREGRGTVSVNSSPSGQVQNIRRESQLQHGVGGWGFNIRGQQR